MPTSPPPPPPPPPHRHGIPVPPVEGRNRCGGERSQPIHYKQTRSQTGHSKTATKPPTELRSRKIEELEKLKSTVNALQNPNKDFRRPAFPRGRGRRRGRPRREEPRDPSPIFRELPQLTSASGRPKIPP